MKALFYVLSLTWGLPTTLPGLFFASILRLIGHKSKKWGWCRYFEFGKGWGGFSMGLYFFTNRDPSAHIRNHEHGHALQNCLWGPLMPIFISAPSFLRYHYRRLKIKLSPTVKLKPYDSIWFEGQATRFGTELTERLQKKK